MIWKTCYLEWEDVYELMGGKGLLFGHQKTCLLPEGCWRIMGLTFSNVMIEWWVLDPDVDGFPGFVGNLFAVLIY